MKKLLIPTMVLRIFTLILISLALSPFAHSEELATPDSSPILIFVVLIVVIGGLFVFYIARNAHTDDSNSFSQAGAVKHTSIRKNVVLSLLFLIGLIVFLLAEKIKRFVPNDWGPDEWEERIRDLGFFVAVSISTHVIYLKQIRSEDIEEFKDNVSLVIDKDRNIMIHGLTGINQLDHKSLIDSLKKGDILYWHDTYTEELHRYNDAIIRATKNGAKIRFLVIAPFCDNARNRALEVEIGDPNIFANACKDFTSSIKRLMDITNSKTIPDTESDRKSIDLKNL